MLKNKKGKHMFDESLVVQSAVSAFNNAALATPAFFWLGLLMLPLFYVVFVYGNRFLDIIGWNRADMQLRVIKWTVVLSLIWLVLFGGNYVVLRDATTLLPFVIAFVAAENTESASSRLNSRRFCCNACWAATF